MKQAVVHDWNLGEDHALALQQELAGRVETQDRLGHIARVAGVDVAYDKHSEQLVAAVVVLDAVSLRVIDQAVVTDTAQFPYIPGLFSFRELPPLARALQQLAHAPDLIVCDGHGIAHPRRFGLACHVGVLFDVPSIGCGKTLLVGQHDTPAPARGARALLRHGEEAIGCALRSQDGIKPVYVSSGHRVSLQTACDWVLRLCTRHRLPETTRLADQVGRTVQRANTR